MIKIFGPWLVSDDVTDLNYNGYQLWIDDLNRGRYCVSEMPEYEDVYQACLQFANQVDCSFNPQSPLLEKEKDGIRYSMIHPSVSGKISISMRMMPPIMRINEVQAVASGYATKECFQLLRYVISKKQNIMVSGIPGSGKTELIKYLGSYIDARDRIITIEDNSELQYQTILPHRDVVAIEVNAWFTYRMAIQACLRQRPDWMMISEIRGDEAMDLLDAATTGTHFLSTIHARSAQEIPSRLLMLCHGDVVRMEGRIQEILEIGIHVSRNELGRYIESIVYFCGEEIRTLYRKGESAMSLEEVTRLLCG